MKKIIIFGPTGSVGQHVVSQALQMKNHITVFCRNKLKLQLTDHPNLSIIEGDVYNKEEVTNALIGQKIVIIALGSGKSRKSTVRSEGTKNIIAGMKKNEVRRLICQTTLGNGDSVNNLNFFWKYVMFGWFLKQVFLDHELQEKYVRESNLNWTIVRPGAFTDGKKTGNYKHGFSPDDRTLKLKISRADVADFILKQTSSEKYLLKTPGISY